MEKIGFGAYVRFVQAPERDVSQVEILTLCAFAEEPSLTHPLTEIVLFTVWLSSRNIELLVKPGSNCDGISM